MSNEQAALEDAVAEARSAASLLDSSAESPADVRRSLGDDSEPPPLDRSVLAPQLVANTSSDNGAAAEVTLVRVSVSGEDGRRDTPVHPRIGMRLVLSDQVGNSVASGAAAWGVLRAVSDNGQECAVEVAPDGDSACCPLPPVSLAAVAAAATSPSGTFAAIAATARVRLGFGPGLSRWLPLAKVRGESSLYGHRIHNASDFWGLKLSTDLALSTHHARVALLALIAEWRAHAEQANQRARLASFADSGKKAAGNGESAVESSVVDLVSLRRIYSSDGGGGESGGGIVGDCRRLVDLVKLVAAGEGCLTMRGHAASAETRGEARSVGLLRGVLKELLEVEAREASQDEGDSQRLSQILVDECCWHFTESTKPADPRAALVRESLHPYFPHCDYRGEVAVPGATAIRVSMCFAEFDAFCRVFCRVCQLLNLIFLQ